MRFKKRDILLTLENQNNGAVTITVSQDKHPNKLVFGLVNPGNLYMLSSKKWKLIDIKSLSVIKRDYIDPLDEAAEGAILAVVRMSAGLLSLDISEQTLLEFVIYDMAKNKDIDWLVGNDATYVMEKDILVVNNRIVDYPKITRINYRKNLKNSIRHQLEEHQLIPKQKPTLSPHLIISPAVTPSRLKVPANNLATSPKMVELEMVQKSPVSVIHLEKDNSEEELIERLETLEIIESQDDFDDESTEIVDNEEMDQENIEGNEEINDESTVIDDESTVIDDDESTVIDDESTVIDDEQPTNE